MLITYTRNSRPICREHLTTRTAFVSAAKPIKASESSHWQFSIYVSQIVTKYTMAVRRNQHLYRLSCAIVKNYIPTCIIGNSFTIILSSSWRKLWCLRLLLLLLDPEKLKTRAYLGLVSLQSLVLLALPYTHFRNTACFKFFVCLSKTFLKTIL